MATSPLSAYDDADEPDVSSPSSTEEPPETPTTVDLDSKDIAEAAAATSTTIPDDNNDWKLAVNKKKKKKQKQGKIFSPSNIAIPEGRGSTGRSEPNNEIERKSLELVMIFPENGTELFRIKDKRWDDEEWWKMLQVESRYGARVEIHYNVKKNKHTKKFISFDDFKFIDPKPKKDS